MTLFKIKKYLKETPPIIQSVTGYPIRKNKILLGLRKTSSNGLGIELISGIGGKLEEGETPEEALLREFLEETITMKPTKFEKMGSVTFFFPHKPKWNQLVTFYRIDKWNGKPQETEPIKPIWNSQNELPEKQMWPDNLFIIPLVLANKKFNGIVLYNERLEIEEYQIEEA